MGIAFALIKPDGYEHAGGIIHCLDQLGQRLEMSVIETVPDSLAHAHYLEHEEQPYFPGLKEYLCEGPVVALLYGGNEIIKRTREAIGPTRPWEAGPDTIRGALSGYSNIGEEVIRNFVHASDSPKTADRETELWFGYPL